MSKEEGKAYHMIMRRRYLLRTKRARGRALDEYCGVTGLSRKHTIKSLSPKRVTPGGGADARPADTGVRGHHAGAQGSDPGMRAGHDICRLRASLDTQLRILARKLSAEGGRFCMDFVNVGPEDLTVEKSVKQAI